VTLAFSGGTAAWLQGGGKERGDVGHRLHGQDPGRTEPGGPLDGSAVTASELQVPADHEAPAH
jgi:hypothetical protein